MDQAIQKSAGGQHHGGSKESPRHSPVHDADDAPVLQNQVFRRRFADFQIGNLRQRGLHRRAIERAVGLGAGPAHGRTFAAVEQAELDAGRIRDPAHQPVQRIDLAHQMAFAHPADGGIAGHFAQGLELWVSSRVRAPARADAAAASQPAWPPPITMTS